MIITSVLVVLVLATVGVVTLKNDRDDAVTVSASSTAQGLSAGDLPSASTDARAVAWRSDAETVGAWIEFVWSEPRTLDHVVLVATATPDERFTAATLTFDSAASLLATADDAGDVDLIFAERTVSKVRITFQSVIDDADSISLSSLRFSDGSDQAELPTTDPRSPRVATSSGSATSGALSDGRLTLGDPGAEWASDPGDRSPWVEFSWDTPRTVASVQVIGPSASAFDPKASASAALHGRLKFSDGSTLDVSGIAGADPRPTTVAFMPRVITSVRLEVMRTVPDADISLREFAVYDVGITPPRSPVDATGLAMAAEPAGGCSRASVSERSSTLTLVCPAVGSVVDGESTVVVSGDPGGTVSVAAWQRSSTGVASGSVRTLTTAVIGPDGMAEIEFDADDLPRGPLALAASLVGVDRDPLYVQLINRGGDRVESRGFAPDDMTLQWDEGFTSPLSISRTGTDSEYAASKPARWGASEFGDATFADPADGLDTITVIDEDYLRLRVIPTPDGPTGPFGHEHFGGIVSSGRVGGSGFSAQYGYFEARMLGAPGKGSWPAFWMLDTEDSTNRGETTGEVDAVELYGHDTTTACHATHNFVEGTDIDDVVDCNVGSGFEDWAMTWHTYGVQIVPGGAVFFIDGIEVSRASGLRAHDLPYYFMVNLALGGGWPIDLAATGDVTDLYVDWVRVYT